MVAAATGAAGKKESVMEDLLGPALASKGKITKPTASAMAGKEFVLLYFSASWCPPCKSFTPLLSKFYEMYNKDSNTLEIVYISSDQNAKSFADYFAKMPWLAVPYDAASNTRKQKLATFFQISGIPALIVLDAKTGHYITDGGRDQVTRAGTDTEKYKEIVQQWRDTEAVPYDQATFGKEKPPFGIGTIVSFFMRNPLYIFALLFMVKRGLKTLAALGKDDPDDPTIQAAVTGEL
eukprot:scaffold6612_cov44-Attheya_sp.AAC.5